MLKRDASKMTVSPTANRRVGAAQRVEESGELVVLDRPVRVCTAAQPLQHNRFSFSTSRGAEVPGGARNRVLAPP